MDRKLSIVMPVYNKEAYIESCIETILGQSLKDIEIICVDDGSTDGSAAVVKRLQKSNPNIVLIQQDNQGAGPARNAGIKAAQGEFIGFMDPDDWYDDNRVLQDLYDAATEHGVDICGGSLAEFAHGELRTSYPDERKKYIFAQEGSVAYSDYQYDYGYHRFIYRRRFLEENELSFPPYRRFQDPPFFVSAMVAAESFWALPRISYVYRVAYKSVNWNAEKLGDLARGLTDVLNIAYENDLVVLAELEIRRIEKSYLELFFQAMEWDECPQSYTQALSGLSLAVARFVALPKCDDVANALAILDRSLCIVGQAGNAPSAPIQESELPIVSIIIPVYNGEKYLRNCVKSALNQMNANVEVIIVDDGSTDESLALAYDLASDDSRINVISKENGGLSSARNAGIEASTGEYILFLDCDDFLVEGAVETLCKRAEADGLNQLFFSAEAFYDDYQSLKSGKNYLTYYDYTVDGVGKTQSGQEFFCLVSSHDEFKPSACLQLIRRSFLDQQLISFMPGILHEDNLFTLECLISDSRVAAISDKLYLRRVHEGSIMTSEKGVRNSYGYYAAVVGIASLLKAREQEIGIEFERELLRFNRQLLKQAAQWYGMSDENGILEFVQRLDVDERLLFQSNLSCIAALRASLASTKKELASTKRKLSRTHGKLEDKSKALRLRKEQLASMESSASWKIGRVITSPIRRLKKSLK